VINWAIWEARVELTPGRTWSLLLMVAVSSLSRLLLLLSL
jgi:hypothetical protein